MSEKNHFQHELVTRARETASGEFSQRHEFLPTFRLTLPRPHLKHLEETVDLLVTCEFGPSVLAAAFLHDHERLSPSWSFGRLEREFGSRVAILATWHSHHDQTHELHWRPELHALTPRDLQESDSLRCAEQISIIRALSHHLSSANISASLLRINWTQALLRFEHQRERLAAHAHPFLVSLMHRELTKLERLVFAVMAPASVREPDFPETLDEALLMEES